MTKQELENQPGVIKVIRNNSFYTHEDVQELLGCSRSQAYKIIRTLRQELIDAGKLHRMAIPGKVPKSYFNKVFMIDDGR